MRSSPTESPSSAFYGDIVVHNVEAAIKDEQIEGPGRDQLFVKVSVPCYCAQCDLDGFKGDQNWTLEAYNRAVNYCEGQCRTRGWKFEAARVTMSAWDDWRKAQRWEDTPGNKLSFIYHMLGLKDAEVLHTKAHGLSPFVIAFFSDESLTRSKSSQFGVLLWT